MAAERGHKVAHTTIMRWVLKFSTEIDKTVRRLKKPTGARYFVDETYIKVNGKWKYHYRAVDEYGQTIDYLLAAKRDRKAAARFFRKAIGSNPLPDKVYIDKSGANKTGIEYVQAELENSIIVDQSKYMNNRIESDHRKIKQISRATLGFKRFWSAWRTLKLFEVWQMFRKIKLNPEDKLRYKISMPFFHSTSGLQQKNHFSLQTHQIPRAAVVCGAKVKMNLQHNDPVKMAPRQLERALVNLFNNAQQSSENTEISVNTVSESNDQFVEIRVTNSGSFVPEWRCSQLFTEFKSFGGKVGFGIGLAIVHDVVVMHGGTIYCESDEKSNETTFVFTLKRK